MLGSLILYLKGMRILMFQLSGFYCINIINVYIHTQIYIYIYTRLHGRETKKAERTKRQTHRSIDGDRQLSAARKHEQATPWKRCQRASDVYTFNPKTKLGLQSLNIHGSSRKHW